MRDFGDDAGTREGCSIDGESYGRWTRRSTESLSPGRYWEWTFAFSAGERIVANMESEAVDSYLRVFLDDETEIASDDDGGSGVNARVEFRVPVTGQYKIRASAFDEDGSGPSLVANVLHPLVDEFGEPARTPIPQVLGRAEERNPPYVSGQIHL